MGLGELETSLSSILVTGGAGFIGSLLVDRLVGLGHRVTILDNLSTGRGRNVNKKAKFVNGNVTDNLTEVFTKGKFDYVYHLAAQVNLRESIKSPTYDAKTNVYGSVNVIENAIKFKVKKFIFASTGGAIYSPDAKLPWTTKTLCDPQSPYGLAKLTVEKYLELARKLHGLDSVVLRYSNVYGPRQNSHGEAGVISIFIDNILANKDIKIFGDGKQTRDFVYVEDVVNANVMALRDDAKGTYNVCTNTQIDVLTIANLIFEKLPSRSKIIYEKAIDGEVKHTRLCFNKLLLLGWQPFFTIETGLDKTLEYFVNG